MIESRLKKLWQDLQAKKPHMPHFLTDIRLRGLRGIDDLSIAFSYPVSVIGGGTASGKSTVLFAAACAYRVPGARPRDFMPSTLFPCYRPSSGRREDSQGRVAIEFDYSTPDGRRAMRWRRTTAWNRSFMGRTGVSQPERPVYLRRLSNLSDPAAVRGVLSMSHSKSEAHESALTAAQIELAHQLLPLRYSSVIDLSRGHRSLLFAEQESGQVYSELHMSAGERAILRLSQEITQLQGGFVLIDEVEAGLHPWAQQLLLIHLQQLALQKNVQIIVTTHSPVVLDAVPPNGRVFLERLDDGNVVSRAPMRDLIQNALYGRTRNKLNVLCEDDTAEAILRGVFDALLARAAINWEAIHVGRNTGAEEFPGHAAAFRKFGLINNVVFVLDGDKRDRGLGGKIQERAGRHVPVLFLPGHEAPEVWIWKVLRENSRAFAAEMRTGVEDFVKRIEQINAIYDSASDSLGEIAKTKLRQLAQSLGQSSSAISRIVARCAAEGYEPGLDPLVEDLKGVLTEWRVGGPTTGLIPRRVGNIFFDDERGD